MCFSAWMATTSRLTIPEISSSLGVPFGYPLFFSAVLPPNSCGVEITKLPWTTHWKRQPRTFSTSIIKGQTRSIRQSVDARFEQDLAIDAEEQSKRHDPQYL